MTARVTITDRGLAKLTENLAELRRLKIEAGVQSPEAEAPHPGSDSGATIGLIAAVNEYGSEDGHTPPRPFLRHTSEVAAGRNRDRLRKAVSDVVDGRLDPLAAFAEVGEGLRLEIVATIDKANGWATPNAPSTIRRKGHNRVLRDSETLKRAITFTVRDGDHVLRRG